MNVQSRCLALAAFAGLAASSAALGQCTITGTMGGPSSWPATHGQQNTRLFRDGVADTCTLAAAGGAPLAGSFGYDKYDFSNASATPACVQIDFNTACTGNQFIYAGVYIGAYDPNNPTLNNVASLGSSPNPAQSMSVTIPPGTAFSVVVSEVVGGAGCPEYTFTMTGGLLSCASTTPGACCMPDGTCSQQAPGACGTAGGVYQGPGVTCVAANCQPSGRCCLSNGNCVIATSAGCAGQGGVYGGNATNCSTNCPGIWVETGDAGELPSNAQIISGSGNLAQIRGTIDPSTADMYQFQITNPAGFTATLCGGAAWDTQIFLFTASGAGVQFNDDTCGLQSAMGGEFVTAGGSYYLAVSGYDYDAMSAGGEIWLDAPFAGVRAPDGPGAASPVSSWGGSSGGSGTYTIALTGAGYAGNDPGACCFTNGTCQQLTPSACSSQGGSFQTAGALCSSTNCPMYGGCCLPNSSCSVLTSAACSAQGGVYRGDNSTCAAPCPMPPNTWIEQGDAGQIPAGSQITVQPVASSTALNTITGQHAAGDVDMFRIRICSPGTFSASTVGGATFDTQLFLFDVQLDANGIASDDDDPAGSGLQSVLSSQFTASLPAGEFYLAVSQYDNDPTNAGAEIWLDTPFNVERAPDGPGAPGPVTAWSGGGATAGPYSLALTGTCYAQSGACYANCDNSTTPPILNVGDFTCFLQQFAAGVPTANCDNSTTIPVLNVGDFTCFLQRFAAGCP